MLGPIIGSIALASSAIVERITLKRKEVTIKFYETYIFLGIVLVMLPFLAFFWNVELNALELKNILVLLLVVLFSIVANYFLFSSMKRGKLEKIEPAKLTQPILIVIFTLLLSFIFGSNIYERNYSVVIPALIAGSALIFSHIRSHHLKFSKPFRFALIASVFFALELVLSNLILENYSSFSFYFIRSFLIFFFSWLIFRPKLKHSVERKVYFQVLAAAAILVVYRVAIYSGYSSIGIIPTTLGIMLAPIFVYLFSWLILKEKIHWRNVLASIVILACVLYTVFV